MFYYIIIIIVKGERERERERVLKIGGGVERPIKEWMKWEGDLCAWLRHGWEGEERELVEELRDQSKCGWKGRGIFALGCAMGGRERRDLCIKEWFLVVWWTERTYNHHVHHPVHWLCRLSWLDSGSSEIQIFQWRGLSKLSDLGQAGPHATL